MWLFRLEFVWVSYVCFRWNVSPTYYMSSNPLPDDKILDKSNLKQSADDNFKFDENSRKFS